MIEYKIILILQLLIIILNQLYYNIIRIYLCYDKNNSLYRMQNDSRNKYNNFKMYNNNKYIINITNRYLVTLI